MATLLSTKMTKDGQTTVPREIRTALGIETDSRVYWSCDGTRAILTVNPGLPNEICSEDEFWQGIEVAMRDVRAERLVDAEDISESIRRKLDIA